MRVIAPDPMRLIDLPGAGPTPRPVDVDRTVTGFADLVSLRVYEFTDGVPIEGDAEGDDLLVTLLAGAARFEVSGEQVAAFDLSQALPVAYLPPGHHYRLTPVGPARVAYARARPLRSLAPAAHAGPEVAAGRLRLRLVPLGPDAEASCDLGEPAERLAHLTGPAVVRADGETMTLDAGHTLALSPGEDAGVTGADLMLLVGVRTAAGP